MKNITVPLDLIRRWLDAQKAFVDAEIAYRHAANSFDAVERFKAFDLCIKRLEELHKASRPFQLIASPAHPSREFVKAVLAEASSQ